MLILLGGAPRAGKGIISRRVAAEAEYPLLSLDPLKMGLQNAVPSLGIDADANPAEVGEKMWPLVRAIAENVLDSESEYIFEGDMILPHQAAALLSFPGADVRACFVVYCSIDSRQKLAEIRQHTGLPNDWLTEHDDEYVLGVVEYGIRFSRHLAEQCNHHGLRYFDVSEDFAKTVDDVAAYLLE